MKKHLIIGLALLCSLSSSGKNPYHTAGTKEYTEVTSKLLGTWNIESFGKKDDNKIGSTYKSGTVEFKFDQATNKWAAIFRFELPHSTIDERIALWNKKEKTLSVDSYAIVSEYQFMISKKGVLVTFENPSTKPEIKGSGEQIENFTASETTFISSQTSLKNEGGLGNLMVSAAIKGISGADFIPKIPTQVNYKNLADNSVDLVTLKKTDFKLTK